MSYSNLSVVGMYINIGRGIKLRLITHQSNCNFGVIHPPNIS